MNALDIARAALMEVGEDPQAIQPTDDFIKLTGGRIRDHGYGYRAGLLALMATRGPDAMVRCSNCFGPRYAAAACIPVRDALVGRTCSKFAAPCPTAGGLSRATGGDVPPPEHVPPV